MRDRCVIALLAGPTPVASLVAEMIRNGWSSRKVVAFFVFATDHKEEAE